VANLGAVTKAQFSQVWFPWHGVYVTALIIITWKLRLTPAASGLFVGVGNLAAAALITPSTQRRIWLWLLSSIVLATFVGFWNSHFGSG